QPAALPSPNPLRPLGGPHFALRRHAPSIHAWAALVRMQLGRRLRCPDDSRRFGAEHARDLSILSRDQRREHRDGGRPGSQPEEQPPSYMVRVTYTATETVDLRIKPW